MFIGWLRCPLLMTMFTSIQRQRQRQIQGQRQSQSSENTKHVLYILKAEGARISNMTFSVQQLFFINHIFVGVHKGRFKVVMQKYSQEMKKNGV